MNRTEVLKRIRENVDILSTSGNEYTAPQRETSPSVASLEEAMRLLRLVVFPGFFGAKQEAEASSIQYYAGVYLEKIYDLLQEQICNGLYFETGKCPNAREQASRMAIEFIGRIPHIKHLLSTDVRAILDGDPAAKSVSEVIFSYPATLAILYQRAAHELLLIGVPIIPRIITEAAHSKTGIDIHPGADIGEYFAIDHGTGVVVGETAVIGSHVRLYQGVTLGAKKYMLDENGQPINLPRHPVIEDHVTIYSNTSVLGRITIGRNSVIGGNVWLTRSIPPGSKILQGSIVEHKQPVRPSGPLQDLHTDFGGGI
ncbi:Serine acetyltransferase [Bacteroidales bacterium Barb6XT]|nr:Serine acetyltransferase [Bacteroidales bacterium Barb6XT]